MISRELEPATCVSICSFHLNSLNSKFTDKKAII